MNYLSHITIKRVADSFSLFYCQTCILATVAFLLCITHNVPHNYSRKLTQFDHKAAHGCLGVLWHPFVFWLDWWHVIIPSERENKYCLFLHRLSQVLTQDPGHTVLSGKRVYLSVTISLQSHSSQWITFHRVDQNFFFSSNSALCNLLLRTYGKEAEPLTQQSCIDLNFHSCPESRFAFKVSQLQFQMYKYVSDVKVA